MKNDFAEGACSEIFIFYLELSPLKYFSLDEEAR
jgi:hypothetical protein